MNPDDFYSAFSGSSDDSFGSANSSWDNLNSTLSTLGEIAVGLTQQGNALQQQGAALPQTTGIVSSTGSSLLAGITPMQIAIGVGAIVALIVVLKVMKR